uniref:Uncharacterized protein n=1 Tax=Oryza sativa subsp. japonica TaxID=39947 RepID=Q8S5N7_ORYSJ|nr:Hypothetical protein [Oryza sativa Japonica Group]AAM44889.1 Hypothetical protein [Oryza sativa Japonica Group]
MAAANDTLLPGAKPFSSFQSLTAHIWFAVSCALGPSNITVFSTVVSLPDHPPSLDLRRVSPHAPLCMLIDRHHAPPCGPRKREEEGKEGKEEGGNSVDHDSSCGGGGSYVCSAGLDGGGGGGLVVREQALGKRSGMSSPPEKELKARLAAASQEIKEDEMVAMGRELDEDGTAMTIGQEVN